MLSEQQRCEVIELNAQIDHATIWAIIKQKLSTSGNVCTVIGLTAIRVLNDFRQLNEKLYLGNHFYIRGGYVDTIGLDMEIVTKYIRYQVQKERDSKKLLYKVEAFEGTTATLPTQRAGDFYTLLGVISEPAPLRSGHLHSSS